MEQEKTSGEEPQKETCDDCGAEVAELHDADGSRVCESCLESHYFTCGDCGDVTHNNNRVIPHRGADICEGCYSDNYFTCEDCGDVFHLDGANTCDECRDGSYYCGNCFEHTDDCSEGGDHDRVEGGTRGASREHYRGEAGKVLTIDRLIGVEIEAERMRSSRRALEVPSACGVGSDGSLSNGVEVQTPPASLDAAEDFITTSCRGLQEAGFGVKTSCGLHVHLDGAGLRAPSISRYLRTWLLLEPFLMSVMPQSRRANRYCEAIGKQFSYAELTAKTRAELEAVFYGKFYGQALKRAEAEAQAMGYVRTRELEQERRNFKRRVSRIKKEKYDGCRYHALNLHSLFYRGTIEIRLHSGTIDPKKILNWAELNLRLLEFARLTDERTMARLKKIGNVVERFKKFAELSGLSAEIVRYYLERLRTFSTN